MAKFPAPAAGIPILNAFLYAMQGIKAAFKSEIAFRLEIAAALFFVPAAFFIGTSAAEIALLIGCIFLVMIVEMLNTAIEALADHSSTEKHELLGKAKDCASGAVLLTLLNAAVIWSLCLYQHL